MIDIKGIRKTPIYETCELRRAMIRLIQKEVELPDFQPNSKRVKAFSGVLDMVNRQLKTYWPKETEIRL